MKKILMLGATLLVCNLVNAQPMHSEKLGIKFGVNVSSYTGPGAVGTNSRIPAFMGMSYEFSRRVSNPFTVSVELLYSPQGVKYDGFFDGEEEEIIQHLGYISAPLFGKLYLSEGFSIMAGPQVGYLVSARERTALYDDLGDVSENFNKLDFGASFGMDITLGVFSRLEGRYYIGLTDINTKSSGNTEAIQNGVLQIGLSIVF